MSYTEVILVNTPPKFGSSKWDLRIAKMLDDNNFKYDSITVIRDAVFGGVYDKLRVFDMCRKQQQYIYFDLDMVIKGNVDHLLRDDFTLLRAWWRNPAHTPLNSSVMSWKGDYSYIYDKFNEDPDYYMMKYHKGIDEFIFKECSYKTYDKVCDCYGYETESDYSITLYSQALEHMPV